MNRDQKKVAIGAVSGVVSMITLVVFLYWLLPSIENMNETLDRIVFTFWMNAVAILPLFAGIIVVGNNRFLTDAIDPLRHAESRVIEINERYIDNTLQQYLVFLVGTVALSTFLDGQSMKLIVALTVVFILARIVFWVGYRIDSLYRAPGMAATIYMNLGIILSVLYFIIF